MALYAFDGTGNEDEDSDIEDTNVVRFKELYNGQDVEYLEGVGTRLGAMGKVLGGLFGSGGKSRIEEMYDTLVDNWEDGDHHIDIIGFSRGAAMAVHFANKIGENGVELSDGTIVKPKIRFLGLWDIVASFGLSFNNIVDFQKLNLGWDVDTVADCVENCFHAMALDERRESFGITRLDPKNEKENITEIWFRGVHSDIGGGNNNPDRSNIALNWMLENAIKSGIGIGKSKRNLPKYSKINIHAKVSENKDLNVDERREILADDHLHPSAKPIILAQGKSHEFTVHSELNYNWTGVHLEKGLPYRITSNEHQVWEDGGISCGPSGWSSEQLSWYKEAVIKLFEDNRRCPDGAWFELTGAYGDEDDYAFRIGKDVTFTAEHSADLYVFANDLKSKYGNNKGSITATIERL